MTLIKNYVQVFWWRTVEEDLVIISTSCHCLLLPVWVLSSYYISDFVEFQLSGCSPITWRADPLRILCPGAVLRQLVCERPIINAHPCCAWCQCGEKMNWVKNGWWTFNLIGPGVCVPGVNPGRTRSLRVNGLNEFKAFYSVSLFCDLWE